MRNNVQTSTKPYLLFDLDGPLLEVKFKYYAFYKDYLIRESFDPIDIQTYWDLKRSKCSNERILALSNATHLSDTFTAYFKYKIESLGYLELDTIQPGAIEFLQPTQNLFHPVLVTMRRNRENLLNQLNALKLSQYFHTILCAGDLPNAPGPYWQIKRDLVKNFLDVHPGPILAMIGDTETDIKAGQALGCKTIAVENGIRLTELLKLEGPDITVPGIHALSVDLISSFNT